MSTPERVLASDVGTGTQKVLLPGKSIFKVCLLRDRAWNLLPIRLNGRLWLPVCPGLYPAAYLCPDPSVFYGFTMVT